VGTLFSTLDIARSGLQAAQVQIEVAGHNIANVNKEGYSRQRVELVSRLPNLTPYGALGRGVGISTVRQIRDEFLDKVYREQVAGLGRSEVMAQYYTRIEDVFLEPSDVAFGTRINYFFDALNDFANSVEEIPVRESVIAEAQALAGSMNDAAERLYLLRTNANEEVRNLVPGINSLADRIAFLNRQIRAAELGGDTANDLRDDRGVLLDELAKMINISYRERLDGQVDVFIASDILVEGDEVWELEAVLNSSLDPERDDLLEVRFVDTGTVATIRDGALYGALHVRDTVIVDLDQRLDTIAATIIQEINKIQIQGSGTSDYAGTVSSTNPTVDAVTPLGAAGLPFNITVPGSFDIVDYDAVGTQTTTTINVGAGTTLNSLAAAINGSGANVTASVSPDGTTISITPSAGYTFTFTNDTAGVLPALGLSGFFTGYDARTMGVSQAIVADPTLLASGYSLNPLDTGDNSAALDMADVRNGLFLESNSATINDYYETTIVRLGVDTRANLQILQAEEASTNDFQRRRLEVSSVSLDEEVTFMINFQRAYEASARVVTVTDRMLDALLNMAR